MLLKLLKYDFRSMWKQFALIWPAALVLALINQFTLFTSHDQWDLEPTGLVGVITLMVFMGVLFAMFVVDLIFILKRFYQGLLGDEGYLMHTLPVKPWQLVASKLISAIFVSVISTVVAILSMLLLAPFHWLGLFHLELWQMIVRGFTKHPDTLLYLVEMCLFMLCSLALGLTMMYLSMALGHLFHRRRVLMSVAAFFVIDILCSIAISFFDEWDLFDFVLESGGHLSIWYTILLILIPTAVFFAITSYILKRRLNLE